MDNTRSHAFFREYLATLPPEHPHHSHTFSAWGFGDSSAMADELGALVVNGTKTATSSLVWEYEFDDERLPQVGDLGVVLDGHDQPIALIETIEVRIIPFNQVEEAFAYDEGEDTRTLAQWREGHWRFFHRVCQRIGREVDETMPILCERFRVIYIPVL